METAKAINNFGLDEQERKDFEEASTAPLAKEEIDDVESINNSSKFFLI